MDIHALRRRHEIALQYYLFLRQQGQEFIAFQGNAHSFAHFDRLKIARSEIQAFHDVRSMPLDTAPELSEERRGEIAYAVLKFDTAFNEEFNPHLWHGEQQDAVAKQCGLKPAEFRSFAAAMHLAAVADIAAIYSAERRMKRDQQRDI